MWDFKLLLFIFIFASLFILKWGIKFVLAIFGDNENAVDSFKVEKKDWLHIGLAITYIITILISGFTF